MAIKPIWSANLYSSFYIYCYTMKRKIYLSGDFLKLFYLTSGNWNPPKSLRFKIYIFYFSFRQKISSEKKAAMVTDTFTVFLSWRIFAFFKPEKYNFDTYRSTLAPSILGESFSEFIYFSKTKFVKGKYWIFRNISVWWNENSKTN
jgi:hypothetical protein